MKKRKNSASSLKTLQQCLFKYYKRYEEHAPALVGIENDALPFGTAVHAALEAMFEIHLARQGTDVRFSGADYEVVRKVYMESIVKGGLDKLSIIDEGWALLKSRMDKFDYSEKVIATECSFDLETEAGTMFLGHIDKVVELDEDAIAIVDYKTSRVALTQSEADDDVQLSMYDLAASVLWPQYKTVVLVLDYIRLGNLVVSHRPPDRRASFLEWLDLQDTRIVEVDEAKAVPAMNQFCGWCEYRTICPSFQAAATTFDAESYLITGQDTDETVSKWERIKLVKRAVEAAERDLRMQVDEILSAQVSGEIVSDTRRLYRLQNSRVAYDAAAISNILPKEDFAKVVTVQKGTLDKLLLQKPEYAEKIRELAEVTYNAASIRTSSSGSAKYGK